MKDLGKWPVEKYQVGFNYVLGTLVEDDVGIHKVTTEGLKTLWASTEIWGEEVLVNGKIYWEPYAPAEKPPLGVKPQKIHDEQRNEMLSAGISRYLKAGKEIPIEWVDEYNEIITRWAE